MNKRRIVWVLGTLFSLVFIALVGLQYFYYSRLDKLHRNQAMQLAQLALGAVIREVEVREFVRYLNQELYSSSPQNSTLSRALAEVRQATQPEVMGKPLQLPIHARQDDGGSPLVHIDTAALSDSLLRLFLERHEALDEYILHNLYRAYSYDSVPQLVNPRLLRERLRYHLHESGVTVPFSISLCSPSGVPLYDYIEPGMVRSERSRKSAIRQHLFVNQDRPEQSSPYLVLMLDFQQDYLSDLRLMLPGLIILIIVVGVGALAIGLLLRQLSFQEMKSDFINNMTHELKTPISSIQLSITQLQKQNGADADPVKRRRYLDIMESEAQRLRMLIDKVLQLSIYSDRGGKKFVPLSEISVDEIIFGAAKVFGMRASSEGDKGTLVLDHEATNTWIMGNETHLTNILYNLLENAVKYRSEGRPLWLRLATYNDDDGNLVITVEDNGTGVPEDDLSRIFDRFYRVPTGLKHEVKGHGLGLAYVRMIMQQFGGTITAINRAEGGLKMTLTIPTIKG